MSSYISGSYGLKYYAEWRNFRGQDFRLEVKRRSFTGTAKAMGHFQGAALEIQGDQGNITAPIVKTQLRFTLVDSYDEADTTTTKYGGWEEFYTPDATLYLVILKSWSGSAWVTRWSGYITPDSWDENLNYRGSITITARDNIGHLQDFPFDLTGDAWGQVSLADVVDGAMQKINLPMDYAVENSNLPAIDGDGTALLDATVNVKTFQDRDWQAVLEDVLEAIGYTLRWTDLNTVTLASIRNMTLLGGTQQPQEQTIEFYGGTRRLDPAFKQIVETLNYDGDNSVDLDIFHGLALTGTRNTYTSKIGSHESAGWSYQNGGASDGYGWQAGYGFGNGEGAELTDTLLGEEGEDAATVGVLLIADQKTQSITQSYKFKVLSTNLTIRIDFAQPLEGKTWSTGQSDNRLGLLRDYLKKVKIGVSYKKGSTTVYWNGTDWGSSAAYIEKDVTDAVADAYSVELVLASNTIGDGGDMTLSFDGFTHDGTDEPDHGDFVRIVGMNISSNAPRLQSDKVTTINDDDYNVTLERNPVLGALSRELGIVSPANYPNALFHTVSGVLQPFPYGVSWGQGTAEKPLPVMIHQQLLMFHYATLSVFNGNCAPVNDAMPGFNAIWKYKGRYLLLQAGTWDLDRCIINGAVLREFVEYDELWDDTSSSWDGTDQSKYDTDAYKDRPASSPSGGGGGGGGGTGTVTSVGMTVPTGLSVSGSPITTSGTFAVTYATGYAIPKTTDVNKGVTAYGWGNHANAGYLTTVTESMIISALGYTPISPQILSQDLSYYATIEQLAGLGLSAPVLQIVRGHNGDGAIDPYLEAFHPMVGDGNFNADFVLMMWSPRRGRKPLGVDASKYRRGWGEARGNGANLTEISFGSSADGMCRGQVTLQTLRLHVLHRYLCGRNQALATVHAMNWQTFVQSGQDGYDYGFGGLNNYSGTKTDFYKKVSRHRMFGIALRVENPAFADAVSGTPDITTRSIADPNNTNHYIPRYYYSAVTPFRVIINRDGDQNNTIGFQLQPICAPMKP